MVPSDAFRQEIFSHKENIWVLCIGDDAVESALPPLAELVDWFNNQLLTKSLVDGKIETAFGKSTLVGASDLLPVSRLLVVGLGDKESLTVALARKLVQDLDQMMTDLKETSPWIIFPADIPQKFAEEIEKSRTSFETLAQANISLGN